jgi:hypothetical protein
MKISLFDLSILQCDRALCHQLNEAERKAPLDLTFDRERIDSESHVDRSGRAMNAWSPIPHRDIDGTADCRPEAFVHGNARRVPFWQRVPPAGTLFVHQVEARWRLHAQVVLPVGRQGTRRSGLLVLSGNSVNPNLSVTRSPIHHLHLVYAKRSPRRRI